MKKGVLVVFALLGFLSIVALASAASSTCNLDAVLVNQDPIHAVPGEYVKVVFQLNGIDNPACGTVNFALNPEYPFSLDPGVPASKTIQSGTFTSTYNSQATIPYSLRVDPNAIDNNYDISAKYSSDTTGALEKHFNISVQDVRTNFDIYVTDYAASTRTITFDILNTGKYDVDALTVTLPKQNTIDVKGGSTDVIGTLDASQDTTFTYEATPSAGNITAVISYNDQNGVRREITKEIAYDPSYFTGRVRDIKTTSTSTYVFAVIAIIIVIWLVRKFFFKKKKVRQD